MARCRTPLYPREIDNTCANLKLNKMGNSKRIIHVTNDALQIGKVSFLNKGKFIRLTRLLFKKVREIYQNIKNRKNLGTCLLKLQKNAL